MISKIGMSAGIRILILVFSFFCSGYVMADSSAIVPAPVSGAGALQPLKPYTQAPNFPADIQKFISSWSNACKSNETRDVCFVRYALHLAPVIDGIPPYVLVNSTLQCPQGYYVVSAFDNRIAVLDRYDKITNDIMYYYDAIVYDPVTATQYNSLSLTGSFTCGPSTTNKGILESGDRCIDGQCGGPIPQYKTIGTFMAIKTKTYQRTRDTTNWGVDKCNTYRAGGCSWAPLCSYWTWDEYAYGYMRCTRLAGFYKSGDASSQGVGVSPLYTPSVVICSKPNIAWQK